ncbi:MAG TPA: hypothetical protein PLM53_14315 [Spirochaetota bacterium]|mgnify:CR=1 FL=1|nr:hypothetical protein [Spirochaetota bacterium]HPC41653.1 hypothetical protein [Spirochaetota bacterium]HPL16342.1 hypothetical protein [Spirochaetota bacterium]HQF09322.1 hypothetical protein [Spirochaetota bacterium]HQH98270.1 hypothetical protein [Spirochaetota bacterium]
MKKCIPLLMFIMLPLSASAAADEYGAREIATFTRYLIDHKEYYRALVELKRLKSLEPGSLSPSAFAVTENYLLFHGKQYREILDGPSRDGASMPAGVDALFRFDAAVALRDYGRADSILAAGGMAPDPFIDRCLKKRRLFSYLASRRFGEATALCGAPPAADYSACRELLEQARAGFSRERKPWLAAVMGIVPGMGYLYAGEYATGIFAFFLISIDVIMTYFAFRTHNDIIGYFTGVIGGFFYAGSIAGGYLAAQRFNVGLGDSMGETLSGELRFDRDRDEIFKRHGIGGN